MEVATDTAKEKNIVWSCFTNVPSVAEDNLTGIEIQDYSKNFDNVAKPLSYSSDDLLLRMTSDEKRQPLAEGLCEFWNPSDTESNKFQDVEIFCGKGGDVIQAHRLILGAISSVFKKALKSLPCDEVDSAFIIPDIHSDQLCELLGAIYTGGTNEVVIPDELQYLKFSPNCVSDYHLEPNMYSKMCTQKGDSELMSDNSLFESKVRSRRSFIWDYYTKLNDKEASCCNQCGKICNMFSGNTSGLIKHLRNHHQQIYLEFKEKRMNGVTSSRNNTFHIKRSTNRKMRHPHQMTTRLNRAYKENNLDIVNSDSEREDNGDLIRHTKTDKSADQQAINFGGHLVNETQISSKTKGQAIENALTENETGLEALSNNKIEQGSSNGYIDQDTSSIALDVRTKDDFQANIGGDKRSFCWNFFIPILSKKGKQRSKCTLCRKVYHTPGGSTSSMLKHLKTKHSEVLTQQANDISTELLSDSQAKENINYTDKKDLNSLSCEQYLPIVSKDDRTKFKKTFTKKGDSCLLFTRKQVQGTKKPSLVWNFYTKMTEDTVQCKVCSKIYIARKGTTTSLMKHLRTSHLDYCKLWERENIAAFDAKVLQGGTDTFYQHPIWMHYNLVEIGKYLCKYCDIPLHLSEQTHLVAFENHLKAQHKTTFDEYEYEKLSLISRKKNDDPVPSQEHLESMDAAQPSIDMRLDSPQKGPPHSFRSERIEALDHISVGLSNIMARDFFTHVHKEIVHCTLCSASTKAPKLGHNSSHLLWQHLKISHEDVHNQLKLEKEDIAESLMLESDKHPIWLHFKETKVDSFMCLDCDDLIEMVGLTIKPLETHLYTKHLHRYEKFQEDLQIGEVVSSLEELVDFTTQCGLSKLINGFYKQTVNKDTLECRECLGYVNTKENCETSLVAHMKQNHSDALQKHLLQRRRILDPETKENFNINLGECICDKCDQARICLLLCAPSSFE